VTAALSVSGPVNANRLASLYPRQRIREVSLLLRLRLAASAQLRLMVDDNDRKGSWEELPEATQAQVLGLLARLIARGVIEDGDGDD
jgi:hypothetical protein